MPSDDASTTAEPTLVVRLSGEVATKAPATRRRFERRLVSNLRDALASAGIDAAVEPTRGRIFVRPADSAAEEVVARVAGVQSVSLAEPHPADRLEDVVAAGVARFAEPVAGRRFAVRARRVGERAAIALAPRDVETALGAALLPRAARVDLSNPEVTVHVELHGRTAYLFAETRRGPGGLPVGVEGRAIALVSGGFDSAVAAWQILRRGVALDYVFCNLGGAAHQLGVLRVMKVIAEQWSHGTRPRLHAVDFSEVSEELRARTEPRYWQVVLKRLMLRAGEAVARERRAQALVTGEAIGQVSSQTLKNLAVISEATRLPILRPLVGQNKDDIIATARHIGTEELSAVVNEYCAMVPRRPATAASLEAVRAQEEKLDPATLERAVAARRVLDLRALSPDDTAIRELEIHEIPPDAVILDLRSREAFRSWHLPGALHLDFPRALAAYGAFDKEKPYVLYCEFGLKSAHLAELMRRAGLRAWHLPGGSRDLRRREPSSGHRPG